MISWDFNTATLLAILVQIVLSVAFVVRIESRANTASDLAKEAHKMAKDAHDKIGIVQASLSLHREQVAREYIDREALREMKEDLSRDIQDLSKRIDDALRKRT